MHRLGRILLVVLSAAVLSGCVFFETRADRNIRRAPNFKAGYSDGCAAASATGVNFREDTVRDQALYETDKAYRAGWAAGMSACHITGPTEPSRGPVPDMNPGAHP